MFVISADWRLTRFSGLRPVPRGCAGRIDRAEALPRVGAVIRSDRDAALRPPFFR